MRYFWFFLKGFVEDLLDAFWSENSVLDFFGKFFLVTEYFGQNFLVRIFIFRCFFRCFFVDCVLYYRDSFWRVLWKTFWVLFEVKMLFEVKIQFWIFFGKFFWWQNFLVIFLVRIFIFRCFFVDCVLYYRDSFWRVLLKTFWMLFEVKIQFWIFLGNFFWWQNFLVRIFLVRIFIFRRFFRCFFVDCVLYYRDSFWRVLWKTFWVLFEVKMLFEVKIQFWIFFGKFFWWQNFLVIFLVRIFIFRCFFVDCVLYYRDRWSIINLHILKSKEETKQYQHSVKNYKTYK